MELLKDERGCYKVTDKIVDFIKEKYYKEGYSQYQISKILNCGVDIIRKTMIKYNLKVRTDSEQARKYTIGNESYFENIDSEHKAYWVGFFYADGFIMNKTKYNNYKVGISLMELDRGILEKLKEDINTNYPLKKYRPNTEFNSKDYYRLLMTSNKMAEDLISKGCCINKTLILSFPNENILSQELIRHFIRGYMDGDGCITIANNHPKIKITGTLEILNGIKKYFKVEHLQLYERHPERHKNNYSLDIGGRKQVKKLLDILYQDSTISLKRKYNKYIEVTNL